MLQLMQYYSYVQHYYSYVQQYHSYVDFLIFYLQSLALSCLVYVYLASLAS